MRLSGLGKNPSVTDEKDPKELVDRLILPSL